MREGKADAQHKAAGMMKHSGELTKLARSDDAQRLIRMLQQEGDVQDAAKAAAAGDPSQLLRRMQQLMSTQEGAQLVERISRQARESGLAD